MISSRRANGTSLSGQISGRGLHKAYIIQACEPTTDGDTAGVRPGSRDESHRADCPGTNTVVLRSRHTTLQTNVNWLPALAGGAHRQMFG